MASKEEIQKKLIEEANVSLADQLSLVGQIQDQMSFLLKTQKDVYTQDKESLSLVKEAYAQTKKLTSEYLSSKDVQKDIAKNKTLQNELARQQNNLEKELGEKGKQRLQFITNQEKGLEKSRSKLAELRAAEEAGIKGAKEQADALGRQIFSRQKGLNTQKEQLTSEEIQYQLLMQTQGVLKGNNKQLEEELKRTKTLEDAQSGIVNMVGKLGQVFDKLGMSKTGKVLTDTFEKAKKEIYEVSSGGTRAVSGFEKMKIAAKAFGGVLKTAFGPLGLLAIGVSMFEKFKENAKEGRQYLATISDSTKEFTAQLGVSVTVGQQLYGTARNIGATMGMTREQATGAAKEIYGALGGVETVSDKTMKTFMKLSVHGGVAADTLKEMHTFAKMTGEDAGDVAQNVARTAQEQIKGLKLNVSMKQIMKDVAGVSNNVKIQFGGSAEAITKAVTKAKKLGLEMKDVEGIASSLLNIEDSLAAEMEAELLTGKELNLEKARAAALAGDQGKLMDELAAQGINEAEYSKMNVLQREALAKAMGMTKDQMDGMLIAQKENTAENTNMVDLQKQGIEAMTAMASLGDQLARQEEERLAALTGGSETLTAFEKSMNDLRAAAQPLLDMVFIPILNTLTSIVSTVAGFIGGITKSKEGMEAVKNTLGFVIKAMMTIKGLQIAINGVMAIGQGIMAIKKSLQKTINKEKVIEGQQETKNQVKQAAGFLKTVGTAVMKVISSLASIPVAGWALGAVAAAAVAGMAAKYMNDGVQGPVTGGAGYSRTMYGPEGAISFNDKDTIVAGTNLGGGGGGNDATVTELQRISGLLNQLLNKEGGVYIDGNKVGATIALTNYQQQ